MDWIDDLERQERKVMEREMRIRTILAGIEEAVRNVLEAIDNGEIEKGVVLVVGIVGIRKHHFHSKGVSVKIYTEPP